MLSVLIEFEVIDGRENEFKTTWVETTKYIYENFNSLGSRLHKSTSGKFIAYAQWPSIEEYESDHEWSTGGREIRKRMRETLVSEKATVLEKLTQRLIYLRMCNTHNKSCNSDNFKHSLKSSNAQNQRFTLR